MSLSKNQKGVRAAGDGPFGSTFDPAGERGTVARGAKGSHVGTGPDHGPIQFEKADYTTPAPSVAACDACQAPIAATYYEAAGRVVCEPCATVLRNPPRSGWFLRGLAALGLGCLAAAVGSGLYYGVAAITGYEISLVAIVVGALVGIAVRYGGGGRGGWFYQLLAVALTYVAIAESYSLHGLQQYLQDPNQFASEAAAAPTEDAGTPSAGDDRRPISLGGGSTGSAARPEENASDGPPELWLFLVAISVFSLAAPVLSCMESPIGALIIGFGLFQAWTMNRRPKFAINGPFAVGSRPPPPSAQLPLPN